MDRRDLIPGTHREANKAAAASTGATSIVLVGVSTRGGDADSHVDLLATFGEGPCQF